MSMYPRSITRCQHIKVNGTQCGSPSLKSHRLCFFHNRWREAHIDFTRSGDPVEEITSLDLPVLEDANSVQVAIMQVLRLILAKQLEPKIAGLLLYGLQTASLNLKQADFKPFQQNVVIEPQHVGHSPLGEYVWDPRESKFQETEEEGDEAPQAAATIEAGTNAAGKKLAQESPGQQKVSRKKKNRATRAQFTEKEELSALRAKIRTNITTLLAPMAKRQMQRSP